MAGSTNIVIGGGIAGLALSLGLARAGHVVTLCEQAEAFAPVGAGITLSPSACAGLAWLGLGERLDEAAETGEAPILRDWSTGHGGGAMAGTPHLGRTRRISRADLHAILLDALRQSGAARIAMGVKLSELEDTANGVVARMADGTTVAGSRLFGADGARSAVRRALFDDGQPAFTGYVAWRFMLPAALAAAYMAGRGATITAGPDASLTCYTVEQGRTLNCVAITRSDEWAAEGWSELGDPSDLAARFAGAHPDACAIVAMATAGNLFRWGLFDRPVASRWSKGRVTLLGDAAHPLLPFLAFGAGLAIEDAVVLARAIATLPPERAIAAFDAERIPRAMRLHAASRAQAAAFAGADGGELPDDAPMMDPAIFAYDPVTVPLA